MGSVNGLLDVATEQLLSDDVFTESGRLWIKDTMSALRQWIAEST